MLVALSCSKASENHRDSLPDTGSGGSSTAGTQGSGGSNSGGGGPMIIVDGGPDDTDGAGQCQNLQCRQVACDNGVKTTLKGVVFAPNGTLPLYNVLVYVPNAPLPPVAPGLSCDRCGGIPPGTPVVGALSNERGQFVLEDVPTGDDVPLVIQVGKWRRQIVVPHIDACTENTILDSNQTRLPRNRSEGDMPRIAVTTGSCDNLICLLPKLGIDQSEWGISGEDKMVTFFSGAEEAFDVSAQTRFDEHLRQMRPASELWGDSEELKRYDVALLSCECAEHLENKGDAAYRAVTDYLLAGGRVFGTDYQYVWHDRTPNAPLAEVTDIQQGELYAPGYVVQLDTTFPKGRALADWLLHVQPASTYGSVECSLVFNHLLAVQTPAAQIWGSSAGDDATVQPRFMTVNAPVGVPLEQQCGKAVHLDAHITAFDVATFQNYPAGCGTALAPGEQVLAFFFFDLAACIQDETKPPLPPPIIK